MTPGFETLAVARQFDGKLLKVDRREVRAPDGTLIVRETITHPGSVAVAAVTDDAVYLIRQMRVAVGRELLEVPAGLLDVPGEAPEVAARRECAEEVGWAPGHLELIAEFYPSPGYTDEFTRLYLATELRPVPVLPSSAEERASQVVKVPVAELGDLVASGAIADAKTLLAVDAIRRRRG